MKKLAAFLRSVIPADPYQLVFLFGVVCLTICPRVGWVPRIDSFKPPYTGPKFSPILQLTLAFAGHLIIFSSLAGYFVCFWPGTRPVRRLFLAVVGPAFFGLISTLAVLVLSSANRVSVLETGSDRASEFVGASWFYLKNSGSVHFGFLGLLLVLVFASRVALGASQLPLRLQPEAGDEDPSWYRTTVLTYLLIGPKYLVGVIVGLPVIIAAGTGIHVPSGTLWDLLFDVLRRVLGLSIVLWVITDTGRQMIVRRFRIPNRNYFLAAAAFTSAVALFVPVSVYLYDRARWAALSYGKLGPPDIGDYFSTPSLFVVTAILAAISEEVVFRGFLQEKMIERYGLLRGLFITGMTWAAIHFRFDPYPRHFDLGVLIHLTLRIAMCLALSFVFGWLTLKSRSVLPAMIAHAATNFFADSAVAFPQLPGESPWAVNIILWVILAWGLFRYWPPQLEPQSIPVATDGPATSAT